jgi:hypothetical protein
MRSSSTGQKGVPSAEWPDGQNLRALSVAGRTGRETGPIGARVFSEHPGVVQHGFARELCCVYDLSGAATGQPGGGLI